MRGKSGHVRAEKRNVFKRKLRDYVLLKKVVVDGDGTIFRATDDEIAEAIGGDPKIPSQWTAETHTVTK
ncbi:unnamed protein product [Pylaiella littoralis]